MTGTVRTGSRTRLSRSRSSSVTEAMSPGATPATPLKLGFGLFVTAATGVSDTAGAIVSTVKIDAACSCPCCRLRPTVRPGRCRCLRSGLCEARAPRGSAGGRLSPSGSALPDAPAPGVDLQRHRWDVARRDAGAPLKLGFGLLVGGQRVNDTAGGVVSRPQRWRSRSCRCSRLRLTVRPGRCRCLRAGLPSASGSRSTCFRHR